jgi:tRNA dimethylallyltransferase
MDMRAINLQNAENAAQRLNQPERAATLSPTVYHNGGPSELTKMPEFSPVVAIVGPTAVGKSRLAMELARVFDGEIVSADSRQVYRYMDIGTDKASCADRAEVSHHMIDVAAPDDVYSAQRFRVEAERVLRRLAAQRRVAFIVGGTGFYIRALLDSLLLPPVEPIPALRRRLEREASAGGSDALHRRLAERDPTSAARIHPKNLPRLIRALEIVEQTGKPVPAELSKTSIPALYLGLRRDRRELWRLADQRALEQVRAGLPEETRLLLEMGYDAGLPSMQGFGYKQMVAYLRGTMTLADALAGYRLAQHRFIRRQMTWFGGDERIAWLDAGDAVERRAREMVSEWIFGSRGKQT